MSRSLKILFGQDEIELVKHQRLTPVEWVPAALINAHMVMTGDSGTGKTHNIREFIRQIDAQRAAGTVGTLRRVHLMDSHGDLDVPGASEVMFSQTTPYAFNPFDVDPDPHFGGVRRAINNFLGLLSRTSRKLGPTQESVLRALLMEAFRQAGFHPDDPSTWAADGGQPPPGAVPDRLYLDVPYEEREIAKAAARADGVRLEFQADVRCWWASARGEALQRWPLKTWGRRAPTIHDVIRLTEWRLKSLFVGTDNRGMAALEELHRAQAALRRAVLAARRQSASLDDEELQAKRDKAAEKARGALDDYITHVSTGTELDELIRYESADTLKSLLDRLENLRATGVARSQTPPFDDAALVWRYDIRAYGDDEKRLFVENWLLRLFTAAKARGVQPGVTDLVVIDEAPKYLSEDSDHIINTIIYEARKFGIALVLVSQSPTQYPESVLSGVGCKIILGLDPMYTRMAMTKLALDERILKLVVPRQRILVNLKENGQAARWHAVRLPGASAVAGRADSSAAAVG
ncbi:MAG: hypothetical protein KGL39_21570 [Patescibacteria group bacterium]|nr:hypothetical protein [Patescibacteria group bacterium]